MAECVAWLCHVVGCRRDRTEPIALSSNIISNKVSSSSTSADFTSEDKLRNPTCSPETKKPCYYATYVPPRAHDMTRHVCLPKYCLLRSQSVTASPNACKAAENNDLHIEDEEEQEEEGF
jgi:hypothetical protein